MPKKSLVIGLGGTGDWVLTFLKGRLYAAYGNDAVEKDVQFLLVDTIEPRVRHDALSGVTGDKITVGYAGQQHEERVAKLGKVHLAMHEYLGMVGEAQSTASKIQNNDPHTQHLDWFPASYYLSTLPAAALNISMGAGQWRQIGRLAMVLHSGAFVNRVSKLVSQCDVQQNETLMVYIVCSMGGGTGAGMFLDAAALVRKQVAAMDKRCWVIGFLLLPGAFAEVWGEAGLERAVPRSYAAYRELTRFQTQGGRNVPFPIAYSSTNQGQTVDVDTKLYDTVFLVDAVRELARAKPWDGVSPSIADTLEVFIDRTRGWRILENLINASASQAGGMKITATQPAQFHSIGSHKIVLPARQYGHIFTSQFVRDLLHLVFPTQYAQDGQPVGLLEAPIDADAAVLDFMANAGHVFMQMVAYLPGGPKSSKSFGEGTLQSFGALLRPKEEVQGRPISFAILDADPLDQDDPEKAIDINGNEEPEEAARRIVRECEQKLNGYFTRLGEVIGKAAVAVETEATAALEQRVEDVLNGKQDRLGEYRVHAAIKLVATVSAQCDALSSDVLVRAREKVTRRNSSAQWALTVAQARTQMEGKFSGIFSGRAANRAQRSYIEAQSNWADVKKMEVIFDAFEDYVARLKKAADKVSSQLTAWTALATRERSISAASVAMTEINKIESEVVEAGKSYTSSYGLSAYNGSESSVNFSMGGYQDVLYKRLTSTLSQTWASAIRWRYDGHQLVLQLEGIAPQDKLSRIESGADLYRRLFALAESQIAPQTERVSIFDYFLHQSISPEKVAEFFKEHTFPLIGQRQGGSQKHELYLLVKPPQNRDASEFLNGLRDALKTKAFTEHAETLQGSATDDFDNPYTLTLLYLLQDVRDGEIELLNQHAVRYQTALVNSDVHVVNHGFRCEQEAARIEKAVNNLEGRSGSESDFFRLHPRVTRFLDQPSRVRQFAQLLGLRVIRYSETQSGDFVWAITPPGAADAAGKKVIWLTRRASSAEDDRTAMSLLLAIEQFCLGRASVNPQARQPIDYAMGIEPLIKQQYTEIRANGGFPGVIAKYQEFLSTSLPEMLDGHVTVSEDEPLHSKQEHASLGTIIRYYLEQEIAKLKAMERATK